MNRIARQKRKAKMRNRVVEGVELAPDACVICGRPRPEGVEAKAHPPTTTVDGWKRLAGSQPLGAIVCSFVCMAKAVARHAKTGRVDVPTMRSLP